MKHSIFIPGSYNRKIGMETMFKTLAILLVGIAILWLAATTVVLALSEYQDQMDGKMLPFVTTSPGIMTPVGKRTINNTTTPVVPLIPARYIQKQGLNVSTMPLPLMKSRPETASTAPTVRPT